MNLGIISEVAGYPWAGSEELWLATAMQALDADWRATASLHSDLHGAAPLFDFVESGGSVSKWQRSRFARIESIKQKFAPNFTTKKLGNPDILLLSAGSLPSLIHLPGLEAFLSESKVPYVVNPIQRRLASYFNWRTSANPKTPVGFQGQCVRFTAQSKLGAKTMWKIAQKLLRDPQPDSISDLYPNSITFNLRTRHTICIGSAHGRSLERTRFAT